MRKLRDRGQLQDKNCFVIIIIKKHFIFIIIITNKDGYKDGRPKFNLNYGAHE